MLLSFRMDSAKEILFLTCQLQVQQCACLSHSKWRSTSQTSLQSHHQERSWQGHPSPAEKNRAVKRREARSSLSSSWTLATKLSSKKSSRSVLPFFGLLGATLFVVLREGTLVRDRFLRQNLFIRLLGITVRRASAMAFVKVLKLFITM